MSPGSLGRSHLEKEWIEKWIIWLKEVHGKTPDSDVLLFPSRVGGHEKLTEAALDKRIKIR